MTVEMLGKTNLTISPRYFKILENYKQKCQKLLQVSSDFLLS